MHLHKWFLAVFISINLVSGLPQHSHAVSSLIFDSNLKDKTRIERCDSQAFEQPSLDPHLMKRVTFNPESFQTHFQLGDSGLWIACDLGVTMVEWLLTECFSGIHDRIIDRAVTGGGLYTLIPDGVLNLVYGHILHGTGLVLDFMMTLAFYGPEAFTFARALNIVGLLQAACNHNDGYASALTRFVMYENLPNGSFLKHVQGSITENTRRLQGVRRLNELQNVTLDSNSSTNIDLATLPQDTSNSSSVIPASVSTSSKNASNWKTSDNSSTSRRATINRQDRSVQTPTKKRTPFNPDDYDVHTILGSGPYYIAVKFAESLSPWLFQIAWQGLQDSLGDIAHAAGNPASEIPDNAIQVPYILELTAQQLALHFTFSIASFGGRPVDWTSAINLLAHLDQYCENVNVPVLLSQFMVYSLNEMGTPSVWIRGSFTEQTFPVVSGDDGRRLMGIQNTTMLVDLSSIQASDTNITGSSGEVGMQSELNKSATIGGEPIASLNFTKTLGSTSRRDVGNLHDAFTRKRSNVMLIEANSSLNSFDPQAFNDHFQLTDRYWIAVNYEGGALADWLFRTVWGFLQQNCQNRERMARARPLDPIPGDSLSLTHVEQLPLQGLALEFLFRITRIGARTLTWALASDVVETLNLICHNQGLYELISKFVIYYYDQFGILQVLAQGEFIEDTHPLLGSRNHTSNIDLQNLPKPVISSFTGATGTKFNLSSIGEDDATS